MDKQLHSMDFNDLKQLSNEEKQCALTALESGQIIYLPNYTFKPNETEQILLSESILDGKHKNISYDYHCQRIGGLAMSSQSSVLQPTMKQFMHCFATYARQLVEEVLPGYQSAIQWGRTSYRPAEINGRPSSKRKDDTRLHVDSFPSTPVHELRILRVFCNINPYGEPRIWHLGEPFSAVLSKFYHQIPPYSPFRAQLMKWMKITKTLRSKYDHQMVHLHDLMKLDETYQQTVNKQRIEFPPNSTWLVFTDQVSHAALSGQFLLEQTFYLPVNAMNNPALSPLNQLKRTELSSDSRINQFNVRSF